MNRARQLDTGVIVFAIVCLAAALTWIVPAGAYDTDTVEVPGAGSRQVVIPGSYTPLDEASPQGPLDVLRAPIRGIVAAVDVIAFVLLIGGAFAVLAETGAIDEGIRRLLRLSHRVPWVEAAIIPLFMLLFGLGGGVFGMAEETIPFMLVFVPFARRMGYDGMVGAAIVIVGAQVGFAAAFLNPFTIGIAQGIAEVPLFSGVGFRTGLWFAFMAVGIAFVMRYAARVRVRPETSALAGVAWGNAEVGPMAETWGDGGSADPSGGSSGEAATTAGGGQAPPSAPDRHTTPVLVVFAASLALLVWGVLTRGWYIEEISALFVAMGIVVGAVARLSPSTISLGFMKGARDLAGTAMIIGLARGILVVLEDGRVIDTLLHGMAGSMEGIGAMGSAQAMLFFQSALNFFVPSGSGQAALTMPLMSQLADLVGVTRQTAVLAYQLGDGLTNMIIPTNPVLIGALGIVGLPWTKWARWVLPLQLVLLGCAVVAVGVAVAVGY